MKENPEPHIENLDHDDRVRATAHKLWEDEGMPDGRADIHWLIAKELIKAQDDAGTLESPGWLKKSDHALELQSADVEESPLSAIRKRVQSRAA